MASPKIVHVEVVYANQKTERIIRVQLEEGSTIETAIDRSGILLLFPEINLTKNAVGIFSQRKKLVDQVSDGDRVEIYRALLVDPKEARKKRSSSSRGSK